MQTDIFYQHNDTIKLQVYIDCQKPSLRISIEWGQITNSNQGIWHVYKQIEINTCTEEYLRGSRRQFQSTCVYHRILVGSCYSIFSFMCMFCRSLFFLLYFLFWPLCCLFFFYLRILITSLLYLQTHLMSTVSLWIFQK